MPQLVPILSYRVDTSSMWKNWNTDDTDLTDEHGFFSALQKNLDPFGDPPSCEAGKSCGYLILKADC